MAGTKGTRPLGSWVLSTLSAPQPLWQSNTHPYRAQQQNHPSLGTAALEPLVSTVKPWDRKQLLGQYKLESQNRISHIHMVPLIRLHFYPKKTQKDFFSKVLTGKREKKKRWKKEADLTLPILWDEWGWRKKGSFLEMKTTGWLHGCLRFKFTLCPTFWRLRRLSLLGLL